MHFFPYARFLSEGAMMIWNLEAIVVQNLTGHQHRWYEYDVYIPHVEGAKLFDFQP